MSSRARQYLKPTVRLEPLVCRWHAFLHLLSPLSCGLNLANRYLPQLESFIRAPDVHTAACADATLYGGSFVDLAGSRVSDAAALADETRTRMAPVLALAAQVKALNASLKLHAKGGSLEPLYRQAPALLKGAVEFWYSPDNTPGLRLREAILYDRFFNPAPWQEVALSLKPGGRRKFFLNTPRLPGEDAELTLPGPFRSQALDEFWTSRVRPVDVDALAERLAFSGETREMFRRLFVETPPDGERTEQEGAGVRVRMFGHASVLVQTSKTSILLDPTFAFERDDRYATLTFADLPAQIDFVVISHAHQDHFCPESLLQLRDRVGKIIVPRNNPASVADPSMALALRSLGYSDVIVADEFDETCVPGGAIVSLPFPGEHSDLDILSKQSLFIELEGRKLLFLVDSNAVDPELYSALPARFRGADAMFIGMECQGAPLTWLYGPLLLRSVSRADDQARRGDGSDSRKALEIVRRLECRAAFVYAMGLEPWNDHLLGLQYEEDSPQMVEAARFIAGCHELGVHAELARGCREMTF
jgi:L-ascorbate metabolism protein UlaG (beta-lactamase superfamily)